jgi:2-keto-4-pentenoate hydratase
MNALTDLQAIAVEALAALDTGHQIQPFSSRPRIEPEIVFRLAVAPVAGIDERTMLESVDWVAHGFEVVQSQSDTGCVSF